MENFSLPEDETILEFYGDFVDDWVGKINTEWEPLWEVMMQVWERFLSDNGSALQTEAHKERWLSTAMATDFYRFAHTLRGSGYQFGITPLGDKGVELLARIKEAKWDGVSSYKEELLAILKRAKELYDEKMSEN